MSGTAPRPPPLATTGIGSLPHTQLELALQQALSLDVAYLPQLPRRDAAEYMIPQALDGLPGLGHDADGTATIDVPAWERDGAAFARTVDEAVEGSAGTCAPRSRSWAAWRPFLWEVEARALPFAKAQLTGPLTARWGVRLGDGRRVADLPELERTIYRLVLARALAMVREIRERGAIPIFFFDEPGLYALDVRDPRHLLLLQELRIAILAVQRQGALVGLHCCSNTHWGALLGLGLDYLSLDVRLSLEPILRAADELHAFVAAGGRLALGIVPTNVGAEYAIEELVAVVEAGLADVPLEECLLSPACGLALRTIPECERVFAELGAAQRALRRG